MKIEKLKGNEDRKTETNIFELLFYNLKLYRYLDYYD